jgi:hypothetical protein
LSFRPKQHIGGCEFLSAGATQADNGNAGQSSLRYVRERGPARVPAGKGKKVAVTCARVAIQTHSGPVRRTRASDPHRSHQFLLVLGVGLLRPFKVSCVLKGGGGDREERWSSEESAAGDGSRPLTELADWHSPLEVLFEKIVDLSRSAKPAIPIDDKSEYRPEGNQAPNDCRSLIPGLFAPAPSWHPVEGGGYS